MDRTKRPESLEEARTRIAIANRFSWMVVSGLTAIVFREKGEEALNKIWRTLLSSEQRTRFKAALVKLGIDKDPPAVAAAKYHYFSNSIGGLRMQIIVEHPKKAWIRYLAPWGSYPGIAALAVPSSVRRTILSTWHPKNGELLDCRRLGWVVTKFVAEGHPYDEGYFHESDHDLSPEERFMVRHVEASPEFDPAAAPKLDPEQWPEIRILKGSYNYGVDYVQHTMKIVQEQFGDAEACHLCATGMKFLAAQFTADLAHAVGVSGNDPPSLVRLFAAVLRSYGNECDVKTGDAGRAEIRLKGYHPFDALEGDGLRNATFAFFEMATRVQNGRLSIKRRVDGSAERWTITDEKKWLW
jgi:hypothetical protein